MKLATTVQEGQNALVTAGAQEMSIDSDSAVLLMDSLGKLYSKPGQAVLREYLANAIDAHVEAGGNLPPIQIELPINASANTLTIRDFGKGMSEHAFMNILSRYGASTKRNSNKLTGGFGLGAKSGFAIADEFFMTSYQNGQLVKVRIFKNEFSKSYVEVVEKGFTEEPDGMLVEIVVPEVNHYELSADRLTKDNFFMAYNSEEIKVKRIQKAYLRGAFTLTNSIHNEELYTPLKRGDEIFGWISNQNGLFKESISDGLYAIVGHSFYSLPVTEDEVVAKLAKLKKTIVFNLPIGSVDFPTSREEITRSERTINNLNLRAADVYALISQYFQKELNKQESRLDALGYIAYDIVGCGYHNIADFTYRQEEVPLSAAIHRSSSDYYAKVNLDYAARLNVDEITATKVTIIPNGKTKIHKQRIRPNEDVKSFVSTSHLYGMVEGEKHFTIIADSDEEFTNAVGKVESNISAYRNQVRGEFDRHSLSVMVVRSDDAAHKWLVGANITTLDAIISGAKEFRKAKRAKAAELRAKLAGNPLPAPVAKDNSVKVNWISYDESGWKISNSEISEIFAQDNVTYILRADLKDTFPFLYKETKWITHSSSYMPREFTQALPLFKTVLGEDAKIVILTQDTKAQVRKFHEAFPNAVSLMDALKGKSEALWEKIKQDKLNGAQNPLVMLMLASQDYKFRSFLSFPKHLEKVNKLDILPADLQEIHALFKGDTYRNALVEGIVRDIFTDAQRTEIKEWVTVKAEGIMKRYPLMPYISCMTFQWESIEDDMMEYINMRQAK